VNKKSPPVLFTSQLNNKNREMSEPVGDAITGHAREERHHTQNA
jgi:hypothetical protein